ncbi:MAG: late competence development ComFB family protein [Nostocaceae cyanobacterium]|nr:late competence development ComFB family protein [Nostocaceae cyanobacterium]
MRNYRVRSSVNSSNPEFKEEHFKKNYQNVMESLVFEEVKQQLESLHPNVSKHINPSEVAAYALNRLPALYATGKRGWQRQYHRGKTELQQQIVKAVRHGIVAVERDPLRVQSPLTFTEDSAALAALEDLKTLLQRENLSWENLKSVVEQTLMDTMRGNITWYKARRADNEIFDWEKFPQHQRE